MFNLAPFSRSQRATLNPARPDLARIQPHSAASQRLCQHPSKRKSCCLIIKRVQCIQKLGLFFLLFLHLWRQHALCSRCPWCCRRCRRGTKAPRPVSQQPAPFLASSLTWTPPSCSPQLEHWTLRMRSLLLTTGTVTLKQRNDVRWKTSIY